MVFRAQACLALLWVTEALSNFRHHNCPVLLAHLFYVPYISDPRRPLFNAQIPTFDSSVPYPTTVNLVPDVAPLTIFKLPVVLHCDRNARIDFLRCPVQCFGTSWTSNGPC